jgi:signal transduction histidine kinase
MHDGASVEQDIGREEYSPSTHTPRQERWYFVALALVVALLVSLYPALAKSQYMGNEDLHAAMEMIGGLLGVIVGFALVMRFSALGNRFHLLIGLAFFVNGAEDLAHGLLSFESTHGFIGVPTSSLTRFIPVTYVTGRLMLACMLLIAPFARVLFKESERPKRETVLGSSAAIILTLIATFVAFRMSLPQFIFPERLISRPVDFLSAVLLLVALAVFLREYHRSLDMLTWWISLSISINFVGQLMMSVSKALYDPCFDIAHAYKVLGYAVPLVGLSFYQVAILKHLRIALRSAFRQAALLQAVNKVLLESLRCETEEEVAKTCLAVAQELTESRFGFIGEVNEAGKFDTIALTDPGWHECRIPEMDAVKMVKGMEIRGIYGQVIIDERSLIANDPASHPNRVGTPEGHPALTSFLGVPLHQAGKTVGVIGLANKESGYDPVDEEAVEVLSVAFMEALHRKRAEVELRKHREHLRELVEDRTAALEQANAELEERNRDLDEFTYMASHDLQEPLRKLSAFSHLLQEDLQKDEPEEVNNDLEVITSSAQRMQTLVQDLLALSRSGRQSMSWEEVPLDECVAQALDALEVRVAETGAQIRTGGLPSVRGDRRLLTQLYQNLIGNALKFHGDEPPRIELSAEKAGDDWTLGVADNGIGMNPEYAEQIFLPFKRLHGRREYEGTGIGLAICRKIVERHGGTIWAESEPGKGAHFKFTVRGQARKEGE